MMYIWVLIGFMSVLHAQTFDELLTHPISDRVREFRESKDNGGYAFLARAAFDHKQGMQTRWRALTTMGRTDSEYFRKDLEKALRGKEWFMRNAALIATQTAADREWAVAWSARMLSDSALVVRTQAVRNLLQLDAREADGLLWQQIFSARNFRGSQSLWVRVHMAEALARFASPGQAQSFQRLLIDPDDRLYKWAMIGLEKSTGLKIGDAHVPENIRRQQWLERLGVQEI